jgi:ATP-dependent phosphoenolpyruvate carboxykinase
VSPEVFNYLYRRIQKHFNNKAKYCYVFDGVCGVRSGQNVRVVTEFAWQHHFVKNMFLNHPPEYCADGTTDHFTVINASRVTNPLWRSQGLGSPNFVLLNLEKKILLIGGTWYSGEMTKGVFSLMNYTLPAQGVLPMHCAASVDGRSGHSALFFGLSGTGKTTLSADPTRKLIGDDEHGWDEQGIFNLGGGCYTKTLNLCNTDQPVMFHQAVKRNALLENVIFNGNTPDFRNLTTTMNGRVSYPLSHLPNHQTSLTGPHPKIIVLLTYDCLGVLPPVAKLTRGQALYYFLSGYTAKVAGAERSASTTPTATFSPCFGGAFLTLPPTQYAELLWGKLKQHNSKVYLLNTGWTGGKIGTGARINLFHTRLILAAILDGKIERQVTRTTPVFAFQVPLSIPGVPARVLDPGRTWQCASEYHRTVNYLARMFQRNFKEKYGNENYYRKYGPKL